MSDQAVRDQIRKSVEEAMEEGWTHKEILSEIEFLWTCHIPTQ